MVNLKIFIGASSEADEYARVVKHALEGVGISTIPWRRVFRPGDYGLDALDRLMHQADGAVLIATADDRTWYRGVESFSPRDNIIFELGYFLHAFGRQRIAIVRVPHHDGTLPRVPTDLSGLTTINFDANEVESNADHIASWALRFRDSFNPSHPDSAEVVRIVRDKIPMVPATWHGLIERLVLAPMLAGLRTAVSGEVSLTSGQYYSRLDTEIADAAEGTHIMAVSTVSSRAWANDKDQQRYFKKNIIAATRGAKIRRLFVVPGDSADDLKGMIRLQDESGVDVRVATSENAPLFNALEDMVIFFQARSPQFLRAYIALPAFSNSGQVRGGKLILDHGRCQERREAFEAAWQFGVSPRDMAGRAFYKREFAPGLTMVTRSTSSDVVTCEEATIARGIPLRNELKTLIIETTRGLFAIHLPGNERLSLRRLKRILEVDEARLAGPSILQGLGIVSGAVSAVLEPVWSLPHLIDRSVVGLNFVATNNGTLRGYFRFDPRILLEADSSYLVDIVEPVPEYR